jgi:hypothetical protein
MNSLEIGTSINDPIFQSLVRRKKQGEDTTLPPVQDYAKEDIEALESFCKAHGILGFNFGRMSPKVALQMLKSKMGVTSHTEVTTSQIKQILKG